MQRRVLIFWILSLLVLSSVIPMSLGYTTNISGTKEKLFVINYIGNTLYVGGSGPGNYSSIQDAIDDAKAGDTVFVYNGTYTEIINIDKSLNLIGEQ